jgi:hypothetical protein
MKGSVDAKMYFVNEPQSKCLAAELPNRQRYSQAVREASAT